MPSDRNTAGLRGLEYAFGLLRAEADVFAENINAFKQPLLPQRRQQGFTHQRNIGVRAVFIFRWRGVSGEQRRRQLDRIVLRKLARHAQHFALVFQIQPVAGFNFKRGHSLAKQSLQPLLSQR